MGSASSSQQIFTPTAQPVACDSGSKSRLPAAGSCESCVTQGGIANVGSQHNLVQAKEPSRCTLDEDDASAVIEIDVGEATIKPAGPVRDLAAFASLSIQTSNEFNSSIRRATVATPSDRGADSASGSPLRVSFTCAMRLDDTKSPSQNPNPQSLSDLEISFNSTGEVALESPTDCHAVTMPLTPIWAKHRHQKAIPRRARRYPPLPNFE